MIEHIIEEVKKQPETLQNTKSISIPKADDGSIFAGAGDSYSASKVIYYLSCGRISCFDSYSIASRPEICNSRDIFFVSISGETKSNIEAAERVSGIAKRRIAVTSNKNSKLAKVCDSVIEIPYFSEHRLPGTLSFSLTLQTLTKLAGLDAGVDYFSTWNEANKCTLPSVSEKGTTFFLGQDFLYPIALYASFKLYEFLGKKANAFPLEDFVHAGLFSLRKKDAVNIFCYSHLYGVAERFVTQAKGRDTVTLIHHTSDKVIEIAFFFTFVSQRLAIESTTKRDLAVPYFISQKKKLEQSSSLIY
jgi:fructoselysine-6-P-deglycase FrlB-like protein